MPRNKLKTSDSVGNEIDTYTYSKFGDPGSEGDSGFPFRFTGQKLDPVTGLYYYKNRWYDPETGRFLQTDPIGYSDGMNMYAYVGNDPVNTTDPSGLVACTGSRIDNGAGDGSDCGSRRPQGSVQFGSMASSAFGGGRSHRRRGGGGGASVCIDGACEPMSEFVPGTSDSEWRTDDHIVVTGTRSRTETYWPFTGTLFVSNLGQSGSERWEQVCSNTFSEDCGFDAQGDIRIRATGGGYPISGFQVSGPVTIIDPSTDQPANVACNNKHWEGCGTGQFYTASHVLTVIDRVYRAPLAGCYTMVCRWALRLEQRTASDNQPFVTILVFKRQ